MRKMEGWAFVMCLLSTTFAIPLPQHPGYINFSYEVMTPLKWYQKLMGPQYPHYAYEPMGGWMHHHAGPTIHQTHYPMHLHQMQPQQPPFPHPNPQMPQPGHGHSPYGPATGQNTIMPQYQPGHVGPVQHPLQPPVGEHPIHPLPPSSPIQPMHPQQPGNPNQGIYPVLPALPPVIPDTPLESWPAVDKTKQEEVD